MSRHKLLIQWIGHSDLRAMSKSLPPKKLTKELEAMAKGPIIGGKDGPTKTLLDQQDFDEIYLLSNYNEKWNKLFSTWIKKRSISHQ